MRLDPAGAEPFGPRSKVAGKLSLPECYELCREVHKSHSRTYYFSTQLFPPEVRPHVHALYAFMRYADEIVDNPGVLDLEEQLSGLEDFEAATFAAISGEEVSNPVLRAFANTARTREIEPESVTAFLESMKMDTHVFHYPTFEDLEGYTYGSAAVVGLMMCRVIGVKERAANPHAEALGTAMQLTNFLRDIAEDWKRGRVYLPLEDLHHFGYTEEDLASGVVDERFVGLMRFEIQRSRKLYALADEGMRYIPAGRRYPVMVARNLYAAILERIEALDYDVYSRRAETTFAGKLKIAARVAARDPGEILARTRDREDGKIAIHGASW